MKFYGIEMRGEFIHQKVEELPVFDATRDEGRVVYNTTTKKYYQGTHAGWEEVIQWNDVDLTPEGVNASPANHNLSYHPDCTGTTAVRTSSSTTLILQAKALNDHNNSGDHDARHLRRSQNLKDLNNITTARTNLGLGTAAIRNTGTGSSQIPLNSHLPSLSGLMYSNDNLSTLANKVASRNHLDLGETNNVKFRRLTLSFRLDTPAINCTGGGCAATCSVACGETCSGSCLGGCSGTCAGTCSGGCFTGCTDGCTFFCSASCEGPR